MERELILRMAREAGMVLIGKSWFTGNLPSLANEQLERFAALVAANEREACAKAVESGVLGHGECAAAIRARGEK